MRKKVRANNNSKFDIKNRRANVKEYQKKEKGEDDVKLGVEWAF